MELRKKHSSEQAVFFKVLGSILSGMMSFVKEAIVAALFGTSYVSDVIQLLEGIFVLTFGSIGNSIAVVFMYFYSEKETKKQDIYLFSNQVFTICLFIGLIFATFIGIFPNIFLKMVAIGLKGETLKYAIYSARIMSSMLVALVLLTFLKNLFFIQKDFLLSSFYESFISIITIGLLYLNKNINFFPIVRTSSYLGVLLMLWIYFLIKEKKFLKITFYRIKDIIKELWPFVKPLIFGNLILFLNILIDKNFASIIGPGALSAQGYALKIYSLPYGIWAMQIIEASYPFMIEYYQVNLTKAKKFFEENFEKILFILLPSSIGLFILGIPIVKIIYERGAFNAADTLLVGKTLSSYSLYVIFFSLNLYIASVFNARKYTKISYYISIIQLTIIILIKWFFVFKLKLGLIGLGFSSGIGEAIIFIFLYLYFIKLFKEKFDKNFNIDLIKIILASSVMGIMTTLLNKNNVSLMINIMLSGLLYLIILTIIKENIISKYLNRIIGKTKNGKIE